MNISPLELRNGARVKRELESNPSTFGSDLGVAQIEPNTDLVSSNKRMAGPMGAHAIALMNDPELAQYTDTWMSQFGLSNEGGQFNQEKMRQAQMRSDNAAGVV
ncbi:MAG: hypothetical protein CML73_02330 [Rhodobiaceae bacterium]|jgi:hypothetical protein|nr:hypothetical protein [Rhodobiaceae bacterium]|tara:strand:- start:2125 stop:2436 length:312 start_codon:yes stop_codon:yes gene_type:complete